MPFQRAHLMWATMNRTHYRNKREELITHLETASRKGYLSPKNHGTGRGIIFTAGNAVSQYHQSDLASFTLLIFFVTLLGYVC